jgi:hypothetical protein
MENQLHGRMHRCTHGRTWPRGRTHERALPDDRTGARASRRTGKLAAFVLLAALSMVGYVACAGVTRAEAAPVEAMPIEAGRAEAAPVEAGRSHVTQPSPSAAQLNDYIAAVARAWEPYTTEDGRVDDPLNADDTGDNYGVIMLADVMLKEALRTGDSGLEDAGARILTSALTLPVPNDPFNLLAIAAVVHDGEEGAFPAGVWERLEGPLMWRAGQIGPPTGSSCLTEPRCYGNWRLVWSAGAALLLSDHVEGTPGSLAVTPSLVRSQIGTDLALAVTHAGAPLQSVAAGEARRDGKPGSPEALTSSPQGGAARELSDPGSEPAAYELFSTFMLELIAERDPQAITPAVARLRRQADRYALEMMAPDGQLSLSGRSLDQSWVQAAGAALGARRAALEPEGAGAWRAYAERATSYLQMAYPTQADGLLPIVPGLDVEWNQSIMDGYAALNQYEGLTLWLLSDALAKWPAAEAPQTSLPADNRELLVDDLASSGLVWGRADDVWWEISGHSTSSDPRTAQGLVAVKVDGAFGWRDLLALRPIHGEASSVWTLQTSHGAVATPSFTRVRGAGRRVVLLGRYREAEGHVLARVSWTLTRITTGVRVSMSMPAKTTLHTTVWLTSKGSRQLAAPGGTTTRQACIVTASGTACPVTIYWRHRRTAVLDIGS